MSILPTKVESVIKFFTALVVIAFVALFVAFESHRILMYYMPSGVYHSVTADKATFKVGEPITIVYHFDRKRLCRSTLDRFIMRQDPYQTVWRSSVIGGPGGVAHDITVRNILEDERGVRPVLAPGSYVFLTNWQMECQDGLHSITHLPAPFKVEP